MRRSIPVLEKRGLTITVITLTGKDPDEELKTNPVTFKKAIKDDKEVYDFLISKLTSENDIETGIGKKKITDEMLPLIDVIQNEIIKEHYLKKLSEAIDTSYDALEKQLEKKDKKEETKPAEVIHNSNRQEMLEEYLLSLVIQALHPSETLVLTDDILVEYKFKVPSIGKIFAQLIEIYKKNKNFNLKSLPEYLNKELIPTFDKCFLIPLPKFEDEEKYKEEIIKVCKDLRVIYLKEKIKDISEKLKKDGNKEEEITDLQKQISDITTQLSS
jgi:DNA primase